MTEAKDQARARELDKTTALYNAATDYAAYVNSNKHDYAEAMRLSDALEDAAIAYAEIAGDRKPTMPKTPSISTLESSNGSASVVEIGHAKSNDAHCLACGFRMLGGANVGLCPKCGSGRWYKTRLTPNGTR